MDADSTREDIGYMKYNLKRSDTFAGRSEKIKIEYLSGLMKGQILIVQQDIAEDLIGRNIAKEVG